MAEENDTRQPSPEDVDLHPPCSAIMEMPGDIRAAVMKVIGKPRYLARVLREEAKSAEGWANAHADKTSYSHRENADGSPMTKHDVYAAKAKMLRAAADIFDPPNDNVDLPDTAAQDSASKSNSPAVSG